MWVRLTMCGAALGCLLGCGPSSVGPINFPAHYTEQGGSFDAAPACANLGTVMATDDRPNNDAGIRTLENDSSKTASIAMNGEVEPMLASAIQHAFALAALRINPQSKIQLKVALFQLSIAELASRISRYDADLILDVKLTDTDTKQVLWEARKSGHGHNGGEAGSAINYQETVSRALEDALNNLLRDSGFSSALCGRTNVPMMPQNGN